MIPSYLHEVPDEVPTNGGTVAVQSLSCMWLFATLWTAAHQASLSFTISQNLLKLIFIESVMPSNHLSLCCPLVSLANIKQVQVEKEVWSTESWLFSQWELLRCSVIDHFLVLPCILQQTPSVKPNSKHIHPGPQEKSTNIYYLTRNRISPEDQRIPMPWSGI